MYQSKERGISLITLSIAIILLIIITSILVYNTQTGTKLKALNQMYSDVENLTDKINTYYSKYWAIPAEIKYDNSEIINNIKSSNQISVNDAQDEYYIIDLSALENLSLNYGEDYKSITNENASTKEDIYIINKQSHHVYYVQGITFENVKYYTNELDDSVNLYY